MATLRSAPHPSEPVLPHNSQARPPQAASRTVDEQTSTGGDSATLIGRSARLVYFLGKYRHLFSDPEAVSGDAPPPEEFAQDIQRLGPAFIKIGQALSIRPDLLPVRYLDALRRLQDDVESVPFELIRERVEQELGMRLSHVFASVDPHPLAAASLAQVHAGTLHDGREVVIKVQRPDIEEAVREDVELLRTVARGVDWLTEQGRRIHFVDWIDEMEQTLAEELDYRLEADNLRIFRERLVGYPMLMVPAPIAQLSTRRVLTMERVPGNKIGDAVRLRRLDEPLDEMARELVCAYLDQIFLHGLVHADPHPGNVLIHDQGLGLIDLGMVVRLSPRTRDALLRLLVALADGNGDDAANRIEAMAEPLEMYDQRNWQRRCARLVSRIHGTHARRELAEGQVLIELTRLAAACGLRPPPEIAILGRTLLALEAVIQRLDPERSTRELVRQHLDRLLGERARMQLGRQALKLEVAEVVEAAGALPRQVGAVLDLLAANRLRVRVSGLEESRLLENLQKIANRITVGLICAALVVGAALALRVDAGPRLFGYPGLALVMFVLAFVLSATLVVSVLLSDRRQSRYRARRR